MTIKKWGTVLLLAYLPGAALALDYQFTLGLQGGYRVTSSNFKDTNTIGNDINTDESSYRLKGSLLAAYGSFDIYLDRWILGLGVDYTHHKDSVTLYSDDPDNNHTEKKALTFLNQKDASIIVGYQLRDNLRAYLRGGWGVNQYSFSEQDSQQGDRDFSLTLKAPVYGAGIAYDIAEHIEIRLDYRFATYSDKVVEDNISTEYKIDVNTLLIGMGYKF